MKIKVVYFAVARADVRIAIQLAVARFVKRSIASVVHAELYGDTSRFILAKFLALFKRSVGEHPSDIVAGHATR